MADVLIRLNYTGGSCSTGLLICYKMDSTGTTNDGVQQNDYVALNDGVNYYAFVFNPNFTVPNFELAQNVKVIPVHVAYGSAAWEVRDVLFDAIYNSGIQIAPSKSGEISIGLANRNPGVIGNQVIMEQFALPWIMFTPEKATGSLTAAKIAITGDSALGGDGITEGDQFTITKGLTTERFEFDPNNDGVTPGTTKVTGEYGLSATGVAANMVNAINGITGDWGIIAHTDGTTVHIQSTEAGWTGAPITQAIGFSGPAQSPTGDMLIQWPMANGNSTGSMVIQTPMKGGNSTGSMLIQFPMATTGSMGASADGFDFGSFFTINDGTLNFGFEIVPTGSSTSIVGPIAVTGASYGTGAEYIAEAIARAISGAASAGWLNIRVTRVGTTGIALFAPITAYALAEWGIHITGGTGTFYPRGMSAGPGYQNGFGFGDYFTLGDGTTSAVFEFLPTGSTASVPGATGITGAPYGASADLVVAAVARAISGSGLNIQAVRFGTTGIQLNGPITAPVITETISFGTINPHGMSGGPGYVDGFDFGDWFKLDDGTTLRTFEILPTGSTPSIPGATGVTGASYGTGAEYVAEAIARAISGSGMNIQAIRFGTTGIRLAGRSGANNYLITGSVSITGGTGTFYQHGMTGGSDKITMHPYGMSGGFGSDSLTGGADATGNTRFINMTVQQRKDMVIPLGTDRRNHGNLTVTRRRSGCIGGSTVYADEAGCLIRGAVFQNLVQQGSEVVNNLLAMTQGPTVDSVVIAETVSPTVGGPLGFTGGMTPAEILGFTGGYGPA